jgi:uracil-DNA glycosylase family 4
MKRRIVSRTESNSSKQQEFSFAEPSSESPSPSGFNPNCKACGLWETAETVCMEGSGPKNAKVVIIGEAPGRDEDRQAKPFVGKSGQLLNDLLDSNGLRRRDIYVTNVVKCRPPDNRTPTRDEIKACRSYLDYELNAVKPEYVLLLGATALKAVAKRAGIGANRAQVIPLPSGEAMATYHPAATLHDPKWSPAFAQDIAKFATWVKGELKANVKVRYTKIVDLRTWEAFVEAFKKTEVFSFDVETTGLNRHMPNRKVNSIQLGLDDSTWILPLNVRDSWLKGRHGLQRLMLWIIVRLAKGKISVAQNGKFDNLWLRECYGFSFYLNFDTQLAHHVLDENSSHDLKSIVVSEGGPAYDIPLKDKLGLGDLQKFYDYGADDGYWERELYNRFRPRFLRDPSLRRLFYQLVMPIARVFEDIEEDGHLLDWEMHAGTKKRLKYDKSRIEGELYRMAGKRKINWDSPDQVANLLFVDLGIEPLDKTPGGKPSTDESVLLRLAEKHPIAKTLIEYRGVQKNLSTYIEGWEKLRHGDRIYISTKIHGTVTGRFSSRLHQVPRDSTMRSHFIAPPDWDGVSSDYSQIELRLVAHASGDRRMKMVFQTGGDIHATTASEILGKDPERLTKEERKMAKPVNFGYVYGMWWKKFMIYARDDYGVIFTPSEAKSHRERFFEIYADLPAWHERMRKTVRAFGQVVSLSGRVRRLPGAFSSDDSVRMEAERQGINSPIQGFGSGDMKAMAMIEIHKKFGDHEFVERLVNSKKYPLRRKLPDILRLKGEVHDSILKWVRSGYTEIVLPEVKRVMEAPALFGPFGVELTVPIVADIEIGRWGSPVAFLKGGKLVDKDGRPWRVV